MWSGSSRSSTRAAGDADRDASVVRPSRRGDVGALGTGGLRHLRAPVAAVSDVTAAMLARAESRLRRAERDYLVLVDEIRRVGTLSERIRARVEGAPDPTVAAREVYAELCEALREGRPWPGRAAASAT